MFKDERGKWSSGRALLWAWSLASLYLVVTQHQALDNNVLSFLSTVEIALIGWVGGPRVGQYLFPQIGAAASAISTAKSKFPKRDNKMGIQPTVEADDT